MEATKSVTPKEKIPILAKVRRDPRAPLSVISTSLLIVLPFCICLIVAFFFALNHIRDEAYRYNDDTYNEIKGILCGVEVTQPDGTVKLEKPKITLPDGKVEEIMPCIVKGEGIDDKVLRQYLDSYDGKYYISYENGKTQLVCSIQDGYFLAELTTELSNDYAITKISRNYNSLGEYMDKLIRIVGLSVLGIALLAFFGVEAVIFGGLSAYGYTAPRLEKRSKKKEGIDVSSETSFLPDSAQLEHAVK